MTQTNNRFFDEIGRLMNDAAGAAQGVKREVDAVVRSQAEKILRDLDIVKREEFEAVKDMARLAREENEALKTRIAALEAKLGGPQAAPDVGSVEDRRIGRLLNRPCLGASQRRRFVRNPPSFPCHFRLLRLERRHISGPRTPGGLPRR